jgi:hypothetical protein
LASLRVRTTSADDDGTAIADASGGDHNVATVVDPATGRRDHNRDDGKPDSDEKGHNHDRGNDRDDAGGGQEEPNECNGAACPPNPNTTPPEAGFCCPNGSCSCAGGCDCPDCWVEQLDKGPDDEPLPPEQVTIIREFCCFTCGGGQNACCDRCNENTGACEIDPDNTPIRGGSIRRR